MKIVYTPVSLRSLGGYNKSCLLLTLTEEVEAPRFNTELSNAETLLGNDANFACKLSGKPAPQVVWFVQSSFFLFKYTVNYVV